MLIQFSKKYTLRKRSQVLPPTINVSTECETTTTSEYDADGWPKGPYTQRIDGVLHAAILTDDIITVHLQSSMETA